MNKDLMDKLEEQIRTPVEATTLPEADDDGLDAITNLPLAIRQLNKAIEREFENTARLMLEDVATLRDRADDLEVRANKLMKSSPNVRDHIAGWMAYEEECRKITDALQPILKRKQ